MVSNAIESTKGRRSIVSLLAALVVATVGIALAVIMASPAKPAEAYTTTPCGSSASVPKRVFINDVPYVQFFAAISCDGVVQNNAHMYVQGGKLTANGWVTARQPTGEFVEASGWFNTRKATYPATLRLRCERPYTQQTFKTYLSEAKVVDAQSTLHYLFNRNSSSVTMAC